MRIGQKRHRLIIKRDIFTQDTFGEEVKSSTQTLATRWGQVRPLSGKELIAAKQIQSVVTHEVRLRYDKNLGLLESDYFEFDGRTLNISSIINVGERNKEWLCQAMEKTT